MYRTIAPPKLTGRWRFSHSRLTGRPILEIEESVRCIKTLSRPPVEDNIALGYMWRKATMEDLLHSSLRPLIDGAAR